MSILSSAQGQSTCDHFVSTDGQTSFVASFDGIIACSSHNMNATCSCIHRALVADKTWIVDSRATDHMAHDISLFSTTQTLQNPYHIYHPS